MMTRNRTVSTWEISLGGDKGKVIVDTENEIHDFRYQIFSCDSGQQIANLTRELIPTAKIEVLRTERKGVLISVYNDARGLSHVEATKYAAEKLLQLVERAGYASYQARQEASA